MEKTMEEKQEKKNAACLSTPSRAGAVQLSWLRGYYRITSFPSASYVFIFIINIINVSVRKGPKYFLVHCNVKIGKWGHRHHFWHVHQLCRWLCQTAHAPRPRCEKQKASGASGLTAASPKRTPQRRVGLDGGLAGRTGLTGLTGLTGRLFPGLCFF